MKTASQPFRFFTASYITQIRNQKAANLLELADGLQHSSDASISYHTFQCLGRFHFVPRSPRPVGRSVKLLWAHGCEFDQGSRADRKNQVMPQE